MTTRRPFARFPLVLFTLLAGGAYAQTPPPPPAPGPTGASKEVNPLGWTAKAGLSYVQTTGNSKSNNLGFRLSANYNWTKTFFSLNGIAVRNDSTTITRFATGTPNDFEVVEDEVSALTAANYLLEANLDHNITERVFWTTGAGWLRNTFAGIDSRENVRAGVGYYFTDPASRGTQFKAALLGTLTHQTETIEDPTVDDTFVGVRLMADLLVPFKTGSFNSRTNLDENLQTTDDFRWTWWNSLTVNMNERLGLQVSWLLFYDNLPALEEIDIFAAREGGVPFPPVVGTALVPLKKWDNQFAVSLVVNLVPKKP
jgi:putative salt-induced outer membrane protein YdiY